MISPATSGEIFTSVFGLHFPGGRDRLQDRFAHGLFGRYRNWFFPFAGNDRNDDQEHNETDRTKDDLTLALARRFRGDGAVSVVLCSGLMHGEAIFLRRGTDNSFFRRFAKQNAVHVARFVRTRVSGSFGFNKLGSPLFSAAHESARSPMRHARRSSGSGSRAALSSAGRSSVSPTFPRATQTFRKKPRRLIRLIGESCEIAREICSSLSSK